MKVSVRSLLLALVSLALALGCGKDVPGQPNPDASKIADARTGAEVGAASEDTGMTGPEPDAAPQEARDASPSADKDSGLDRGARDSERETVVDSQAAAGPEVGVLHDARSPEARPDAGTAGADLPTVTVYLAGDSTVSTYTNSSIHQAGWGQMLGQYFNSRVKIDNRAQGGRTARRFIDEGYLDEILADIKTGDYLLVQFGTNDGNKTATYTLAGQEIPYYLDPATDFKAYLAQYVSGAKAKKATTVFVTPPPRHSCSGTSLGVSNGLSSYATAMKELGASLEVPVVDLNGRTMAYLANVACDVSGQTFYLVKSDGTIDSTHFQENGAKVMAGLVAAGIGDLGLGLAAYLK